MPHLDKDSVLAAMGGAWPDFYGQFTPLASVGGRLRGPCPLHGGDGPNFDVNTETGEVFCHSACQEGGDALWFLQRLRGVHFTEALSEVADFARVAPTSQGRGPAAERPRSGRGPIVATYDYTDEQGGLLFQAVRYEPGADGRAKDFRQRRPDGQGGWVWDLKGVRRVLYRLPEVLEAIHLGRPVYLCEGEKDADALRTLGLPATCNPMGAGKWEASFTEALCGAGVVLLPDNDAPGRAHAAQAARSLHGQAKRVRVVELPALPEKGDVSDWIDAGGTREALLDLVRAAPAWEPTPSPAVEPQAPRIGARKPFADRCIDLADVAPPGELPLLFGPYLLKGSSHWLTGQTGLGKSTWAYNLACALAEGTALWGIECDPQNVLYLDMESGDVGRALKVERLYRDAPRVRGRLHFMREDVRLPEELADLTAYVQSQGVGLVIFDTARRCFTVKDENDNAEVYNRIVPTLDALKRLGVATLTMGHPPKNGGFGARGAGAQEDAGDVNLTLTMHNNGDVNDPSGVVMLRVTKNRLLGHVPPLYLKRVGEDRFERLDWSEAGPPPDKPGETPSARVRCAQDILDLLGEASVRPRHSEIVRRMASLGHTGSTAKRSISALQSEGRIGHDLERGYYACEADDAE